MTEFAQTLRHRCRHKLCGSKLPAPVENPREAFCKPGCHSSFYLRRCLVCEVPIEQPKSGGVRLLCKKTRCRNAWDAKMALGRYGIPIAKRAARNADETGLKTGPQDSRAWRIVAGPTPSPSQFHCATVPDGPDCKWEGGAYRLHCATVPDGPDCKWEGGAYRRIEAENGAALKAAEQAEIEANGYFTEPDWREVVSPDGVRRLVTRFREPDARRAGFDRRVQKYIKQIPDDLSIPEFLRSRLDGDYSDIEDGSLPEHFRDAGGVS